MTNGAGLADRWSNFRPSKALWFWSCAGAVVLVMVLGFTVGGWVTGGSAAQMAENAAEEARTELAATICVERFMNEPNAASELAELKEIDSWTRDDFVTDGGWVKLAGMEEPVDGAADLCAEKLADMDAPTTSASTSGTAGG
jgi:hypothetical protein